MLGDFVMGVRMLSRFSFRLKPPPGRNPNDVSSRSSVTSSGSTGSRASGVSGGGTPKRVGWFSLGKQYGTADWVDGGGVEIVQVGEQQYVIEVQMWPHDEVNTDVESEASPQAPRKASRSSTRSSSGADLAAGSPFGPTLSKFLPQELLEGGLIHVFPVLFSQGINERQTLANLIGRSHELQAEINRESMYTLQRYYVEYRRYYDAEIQSLKARLRTGKSPRGSMSSGAALHASSSTDSLQHLNTPVKLTGAERATLETELRRQLAKQSSMDRLVEDITVRACRG